MTNTTNEATQTRIDNFRRELESKISEHQSKRWWNGSMHQGLVIFAAVAGFVSLGVGLLTANAPAAGIIAALTSLAAILTQQLHCVQARSWRDRIATEMAGIRMQLLYELNANPSLEDIAALAKQTRELELRMAEEWAKVTSTQPTALGKIEPA